MQSIAYAWYQIQFAFRLLRLCRGYQGLAVGRYGIWFPILQRILGLNKNVVMTDTEWRNPKGGRLNRAAALASSVVCCFTTAEMLMYSNLFKIPRSKFVLVPLAFQQTDLREARDEGYVFAGGTQGRDWGTLIKAVQPLPYPVRIFTRARFTNLPPNVQVRWVNREELYTQMARASCVVVPVFSEPSRITGNTTWTAAMGMGKVVVVTEPRGAPDYMEYGVSGFYVDYGDSEALRQCIGKVMGDSDLRRRVGEEARKRAWGEFSPEMFRHRVLSLLKGEDEGS
jgi:glycosyltransferase involved in cell wall biosynthesis